MSLDLSTVDKIAHLARLSLSENERAQYAQELSKILDAIATINEVNTDHVAPMAHPMDELTQRLREDQAHEPNMRAAYQKIAPSVEAGLYLVPKVIE